MSAARQGELTIVGKAKDLVSYTFTVTNNPKLFPKKVRFTLCQRMQNLSLQILHDILAANEIFPDNRQKMEQRLDLQKEVLTNCKVLLSLIDIALEQNYIDIRRCEYWTGLVTDVKNMAASWRKKDAERFNRQLAEKAKAKAQGQPWGQQPPPRQGGPPCPRR